MSHHFRMKSHHLKEAWLFARQISPFSRRTDPSETSQLLVMLQLPLASRPVGLPTGAFRSQVCQEIPSSISFTISGCSPQKVASRPMEKSTWSFIRQPSSGHGCALGGSPAVQRRMYRHISTCFDQITRVSLRDVPMKPHVMGIACGHGTYDAEQQEVLRSHQTPSCKGAFWEEH